MQIKAYKTRLFKEGEDLPLFIKEHLPALKEGAVIAVSSKVAGLWEGRTASVSSKEEIIKKESDFYLKTALCYFTVKDGMVMTNAGVILPLRAGVISAAVGYAGFRGVKDYRGKGDIFGRQLKMTMVNIADTLAAGAGLLMGEGREKKPFAVIEDAPVVFCAKQKEGEIKYPLKDDLYYPFFKPYLKKK